MTFYCILFFYRESVTKTNNQTKICLELQVKKYQAHFYTLDSGV